MPRVRPHPGHGGTSLTLAWGCAVKLLVGAGVVM